MEKEFVPYELALRMKALGFNEPCFGYWKSKNWLIQEKTRTDGYIHADQECSAPTFSQVFRWFREKYGLCGYVSPFEDASAFDFMVYTNINKPYANRICSLPDKWKTYEEAELACLEKLIELIENK